MSLKKNFLYNVLYQFFLIIIPLITAPYIARVIGAEGIGIFSFANTIGYFFVLFAMLGVNNYGTRSIAMVRDDQEKLSKTFWGIFYLQVFGSSIIILLYIFYVVFVTGSNIITSIVFLYVMSACIDINWFLFGLEKFKATLIRIVIVRLITLCGIFLFVNTSADLWIYALIISSGMLVNQIVVWPIALKYINFKKVSIPEIVSHLKPNLVLFIPVLAVSFYKSMDKVMLGMFTDMTQLGYYENALRIINVPMGVIAALGTVMLPRMSNLAFLKKNEQSNRLIQQSMFFVIFIASALTFGISGIAPVFAPIFFGEEFVEVGTLITYISPSILVIAWANVIRTQYLIPNHKDKIYIISVSLGAIVNLLLNLYLIPIYGALGAVIATVAAETVVCLCQTLIVRGELRTLQYIKSSWVFIPIGLIMFIIVRLIGEYNGTSIITVIIQISVGAGLYLSLSLAYLIFTKRINNKEIIRIFKSLLRKKF